MKPKKLRAATYSCTTRIPYVLIHEKYVVFLILRNTTLWYKIINITELDGWVSAWYCRCRKLLWTVSTIAVWWIKCHWHSLNQNGWQWYPIPVAAPHPHNIFTLYVLIAFDYHAEADKRFAAIFQTTFSKAFSRMKLYTFRLRFRYVLSICTIERSWSIASNHWMYVVV